MNGNEEEKGNTRVVCVHGTNLSESDHQENPIRQMG